MQGRAFGWHGPARAMLAAAAGISQSNYAQAGPPEASGRAFTFEENNDE
jgi:hypothetical protein